jgi:hypothetical protein
MAKKEFIGKSYFAPYARFGFNLIKRDAKGAPIQILTPAGTGLFINNQPVYMEETIQFLSHKSSTSDPVSIFTVRDNTPDAVVEELEKLADDPTTRVLREKDWLKKRNPSLADEVERRKAAEEKSAEISDAVKGATSLDQLKKKLAELEA